MSNRHPWETTKNAKGPQKRELTPWLGSGQGTWPQSFICFMTQNSEKAAKNLLKSILGLGSLQPDLPKISKFPKPPYRFFTNFISRQHQLSPTFGCFQKYGYLQIINSNRVFPYKPSILGYHYFWKRPFPSSHQMNDSDLDIPLAPLKPTDLEGPPGPIPGSPAFPYLEANGNKYNPWLT